MPPMPPIVGIEPNPPMPPMSSKKGSLLKKSEPGSMRGIGAGGALPPVVCVVPSENVLVVVVTPFRVTVLVLVHLGPDVLLLGPGIDVGASAVGVTAVGASAQQGMQALPSK